MSFITIDHTANINRIIAIIKANASIYDGLANTTKIRKVFFAETGYDMDDDTTPYIFIQVNDQYQFSREQYGTQVAEFEQDMVSYNVIIVTQGKSAQDAQTQSFTWTNLVMQQLKNFPFLDDPSNRGSDKKVLRTNITPIRRKLQKGQEKFGSVITLTCHTGVAWQLTISGTVISLISKPLDNFAPDQDFDVLADASFVVTQMKKGRYISCEYENTTALETTLNNYIDGTERSVTITTPDGVARNYTAVIATIDAPVPFDNLERRVVRLTLIQ